MMPKLCGVTGAVCEIIGVEERVGSLEAGKLADVIVVGGNPLDDLDALEDVRMVYKEGSRLV